MDFRTCVALPEPLFRLSPTDEMLFVGSCFAENVGRLLSDSRFRCRVNPFGVLYNPVSIAAVLRLSVGTRMLDEADFFCEGGRWHSWLNDSSFDADGYRECRIRLEEVVADVSREWTDCKALFLTLGTNRLYELADCGYPVGNCHRQPTRMFRERALTVEETVGVLEEALCDVWSRAVGLKVVFTVSPYRYAKYGFHESRLGKSVLLLAVDALCGRYPDRCMYFPAYEILLDELRDYRFYADDMLHPSATAVRYIRECFARVFLTDESLAYQREWEAMNRALAHRPLHPGSDAHRQFVRKTLDKLEQMEQKYPGATVDEARSRLLGML
ncbi:MAG: GSCFA domain-containing protein [Clostridium sp.]|nr:GSCFA domain-containing protein [Clostridium sp.]